MDKEEAPSQDQPTKGDSENTSSLSQPGSDCEQVPLGLEDVLDILHCADDEFTSVCHKPVGGHFASSVVKSVDAGSLVARLPGKECVWFSGNPTGGPERHNKGRGNERAVTRWAGLLLDLDVKDGSFLDLDQAAAFITTMSGFLGTYPSVVIFSGHGCQPIWVIEDGELDTEEKWERAHRLLRRFGRFAAAVAWRDFKVSLDTVWDLARVLRVPGTVNWKDPGNPVDVYAERRGGGPLTVDRIEEVLDEWAPEIDSDKPVSREVISPPEDWRFGQDTCAYVKTMVSAWAQESDEPRGGRHQWAMDRCVRLASARRLGCVTEGDRDKALEHLQSCLRHWCAVTEPMRDLHPDEIGSAYRWAEAKVATFEEDRAREELGNHRHLDSWQCAGARHADFWERTAILRHIRDFAHARRVGVWALLGACLARVLASVPPSVQLPPLVGGNASLNLFVGLVGASGLGKGAPERAADDAFSFKGIFTTGVGSGEGINHLFAAYDRKESTSVMVRHSVLFSVPEIDMLAALGQRNASTLLPQLRKAWSGEALSFAYAAKDKALAVPPHSYRLTLVAGIQPGRAGVLLGDSDGGTPQRFLWLPCTDPTLPDIRPPEPQPIDLAEIADGWPASGMGMGQAPLPYVLQLPQQAVDLIDNSRVASLRGEHNGSPLDGHLLLGREKVAAALAFLHNCREITDEFWELSGVVMDVSQETRRGVEAELAARVEQENRTRGRREGVRSIEAETAREEEKIKRTSQSLRRALKGKGGMLKRSALRKTLAGKDRCYFQAALALLERAGSVEICEGGRGLTVRLTGKD